jgi:hypothetical protein
MTLFVYAALLSEKKIHRAKHVQLAQESAILRYRVTRYEKHAKRNKPHRLANDRAYQPELGNEIRT